MLNPKCLVNLKTNDRNDKIYMYVSVCLTRLIEIDDFVVEIYYLWDNTLHIAADYKLEEVSVA